MTTIRTVAYDARYVNDQYHGIGRHAYNLLDALTRLDPDRRYPAYYHPGYRNTRFNMEALEERPNVELRPIQLPLYLPGEQLVWPFLLARARADLFHSPYVVLPLLAHIRSVMTVHDLIFERHPEYRPRSYLQRFYRPVTQLGIKRADRVLTVSESTSRDIQAYYHVNRARIHVTRSGVDTTFFLPGEDEPEAGFLLFIHISRELCEIWCNPRAMGKPSAGKAHFLLSFDSPAALGVRRRRGNFSGDTLCR